LTFLEAAAAVLRGEGKPLHYREITRLAIEAGMLNTAGKTPEDTMSARLYVDIAEHGRRSAFRRDAGVISLREWGL